MRISLRITLLLTSVILLAPAAWATSLDRGRLDTRRRSISQQDHRPPLLQAMDHNAAREFAKAENAAIRALRTAPNDVRVLHELAQQALRVGNVYVGSRRVHL